MKTLLDFKQLPESAFSWFLKASLIKKGIVLIILLVVGWLTVPKVLGSKQKAQYQTAPVERGELISTLTESGNIAAVSQTNVYSPTDGVIEEVYVNNGQEVEAGQDLFKVKSTATEQEKASAYAAYLNSANSVKSSQQSKTSLQAQLEEARQAVLNAQNTVDEMNKNLSNGANNPATKQPYTQNEIDSINSALTSAKTSFSAAEAKYNSADTAISASSAFQNSAWLTYQATQDSVVKSPVSGTVANLSVTAGSNISSSGGNGGNANSGASSSSAASSNSASGSVSSSTPVLVIGNFSNLNIKAQVSEVDIPKIHPGEKATITLDAFSDKTYVGTVASLDTIGSSSSGVVTYNVYINMIAPPSNIHPGMTASVVIQTDRKDDVLHVPTTAIQTTSDGSSYVRVLKNGKMSQVPVETGIVSDSDTEITSGLSEGEVVVTSVLNTTGSRSSSATSPFGSLGGNRTGGFGGGGFGGARTGGFRGN
jgi:multidrug efflux pump subunit AcrA (membrane-fusion protein)